MCCNQYQVIEEYMLVAVLFPYVNFVIDIFGPTLEVQGVQLLRIVMATRKMHAPQFCLGVKIMKIGYEKSKFGNV